MFELKSCTNCSSKNIRLANGNHRGTPYTVYRCDDCHEEVFTMDQARTFMKAAEAARQVTFSTWGKTLAVRIPVDVVRRLGLKPKTQGRLIEKEKGFTIVPIKG